MKKVLIFVIVAAGLALFEPRTRELILTFFPSVSAATRQASAQRALQNIALDVQKAANETGAYPQPGALDQWLRQNDESTQDPWGAGYYLELFPDSFVVGSPGPDSRRYTADDVRLAKLRGPNAERLRPGYSPPTPPASGVKNSAMRNAKRAAASRSDSTTHR